MNPHTILRTEKLCKTFSTGGVQQHVLRNIDLEIFEGDFTVVMGASGGGKSTLLYALSGMDTPTLGSVFFGREDIAKLSQDKLAVFRRRNCGFVFQQVYLIESMSVLDNVLISGLLLPVNKRELVGRAKELLASVGLEESLWRKLPAQLSGGEAQRVGVARASVNRPKIIFADEPTGALNSFMATAVLDVLSQCNRQGQSIVMVTHDINSALRANRVLYLRDGAVEGELVLGSYGGEDAERRAKMKEFLAKLGW